MSRDLKNSFEKEFLYYRRFCDRLGKDVQRLQAERDRLAQEVRLHLLQGRFERDLSHTAAYALDIEHLTERVLDAIAQHMLSTKALILAESEASRGEFCVVASLGHEEAARKRVFTLNKIPVLALIEKDGGAATDLRRSLAPVLDFLGPGPFIWEYDEESGYAVAILGSIGQSEEIFCQQAEELSHTALTGLVHGLWRLRAREAVASETTNGQGLAAQPLGEVQRSDDRSSGPSMDPGHPTIRESEITAQLGLGGTILDVTVLAQVDGEFRLLLRPSWGRGFRCVATYRRNSDRTYKDFSRLLAFVRGVCRYHGPLRVLEDSEPEVPVHQVSGMIFNTGTKPN